MAKTNERKCYTYHIQLGLKNMNKATKTYCTLDQEETDTDLKKDRYVSFRLLISEVSELKTLAQAENKNVSRYIRSKIFSKKDAA
jgi:hypothetical protein